mmetsp:Transcript_85635/g.247194  ORF Transcript_85635/g.247194 Transcript_85635/m.247194 type:complete len:348 (+) Transcript_85635:1333-2376(+)
MRAHEDHELPDAHEAGAVRIQCAPESSQVLVADLRRADGQPGEALAHDAAELREAHVPGALLVASSEDLVPIAARSVPLLSCAAEVADEALDLWVLQLRPCLDLQTVDRAVELPRSRLAGAIGVDLPKKGVQLVVRDLGRRDPEEVADGRGELAEVHPRGAAVTREAEELRPELRAVEVLPDAAGEEPIVHRQAQLHGDGAQGLVAKRRGARDLRGAVLLRLLHQPALLLGILRQLVHAVLRPVAPHEHHEFRNVYIPGKIVVQALPACLEPLLRDLLRLHRQALPSIAHELPELGVPNAARALFVNDGEGLVPVAACVEAQLQSLAQGGRDTVHGCIIFVGPRIDI